MNLGLLKSVRDLRSEQTRGELSMADKAVLLAIAARCNAEATTFAGVDTLAADLCASRATVLRAMKRLRSLGLIESDARPRGAGRATNVTRIRLPEGVTPSIKLQPGKGEPQVSNCDPPSIKLQPAQVSNCDPKNNIKDLTKTRCAREGAVDRSKVTAAILEQLDRLWPADGTTNGAPAAYPIQVARAALDAGGFWFLLAAVERYCAAKRKADQRPHEFRTWISRADLIKPHLPSPAEIERQQRDCVRFFAESGKWLGYGPPPGSDDCLVAPEILQAAGVSRGRSDVDHEAEPKASSHLEQTRYYGGA